MRVRPIVVNFERERKEHFGDGYGSGNCSRRCPSTGNRDAYQASRACAADYPSNRIYPCSR
jgi:hypothetical protein